MRFVLSLALGWRMEDRVRERKPLESEMGSGGGKTVDAGAGCGVTAGEEGEVDCC